MDRDLTLAAAELQRTSPKAWAGFVAAFKQYTDKQRENCIAAPIEALPVTQGRAQNAGALLKIFEDCLTAADAIQRKNQK